MSKLEKILIIILSLASTGITILKTNYNNPFIKNLNISILFSAAIFICFSTFLFCLIQILKALIIKEVWFKGNEIKYNDTKPLEIGKKNAWWNKNILAGNSEFYTSVFMYTLGIFTMGFCLFLLIGSIAQW